VKIKIVPASPDVQYSEEYYEWMAHAMGQEAADWARLPREEREKEIRWYRENFNTPNDLAVWPSELGGPNVDD
jgi:hypothetical protein